MRISPVHDCLSHLDTAWGNLNGMPIARSIGTALNTALQLFDLSALRRTGLKGSGAASWLQSRNLAIPERANTWCAVNADGIVARLGRSEFLVEDGPQSSIVSSLTDALATPIDNVYPVLRQDAALMLRGAAVHELLAQTCSIDLSPGALEERAVSLTMMAGISVTIIDASSAHAAPCYRVWCDGTYGVYLWETLLEIAGELGGGAAGLNAIYPDLSASGSNDADQQDGSGDAR
jgi:sarcosine oxidase, subunit gamma